MLLDTLSRDLDRIMNRQMLSHLRLVMRELANISCPTQDEKLLSTLKKILLFSDFLQ